MLNTPMQALEIHAAGHVNSTVALPRCYLLPKVGEWGASLGRLHQHQYVHLM